MGLFVWDRLAERSARKNPNVASKLWVRPKWRTLLPAILILTALTVIVNLVGFKIDFSAWPIFIIAFVVMYELAMRFDLAIYKRREKAKQLKSAA